MNSHAIELGVIRQLLPLGQYSSDKSKNSYFGKIAHQLKETQKDVDTRWDKLSDEERESLKSLAYTVFNPANDDSSSKKNSLERLARRWEIRFHLILAIVTWQIEVVFEAYFAVFKLAHAIMDAVEREEAGLTALFLDKIMEDAENDPSKLIPFTKEMDEKLDQLLNGVELD